MGADKLTFKPSHTSPVNLVGNCRSNFLLRGTFRVNCLFLISCPRWRRMLSVGSGGELSARQEKPQEEIGRRLDHLSPSTKPA